MKNYLLAFGVVLSFVGMNSADDRDVRIALALAQAQANANKVSAELIIPALPEPEPATPSQKYVWAADVAGQMTLYRDSASPANQVGAYRLADSTYLSYKDGQWSVAEPPCKLPETKEEPQAGSWQTFRVCDEFG